MNARFDDKELVNISGITESSAFFRFLPKLVADEDCVIGIASLFVANERVAKWLHDLPQISVPGKFNFRFITKVNRENPLGGAFYFRPTKSRLSDATRMAALAEESGEFLCSHVIGFKGFQSLFSFHDAFCCDPMLVSSSIPRQRIEAFCTAIKARYDVVANPQLEL